MSFCPRLVLELLSFIRALVRKRGHIVAHNVPRAAQTGKRFLRTQNVSEQNQKHLFVSRTKKNLSEQMFHGQTGKHLCRQQCVRNNVPSFARAFTRFGQRTRYRNFAYYLCCLSIFLAKLSICCCSSSMYVFKRKPV